MNDEYLVNLAERAAKVFAKKYRELDWYHFVWPAYVKLKACKGLNQKMEWIVAMRGCADAVEYYRREHWDVFEDIKSHYTDDNVERLITKAWEETKEDREDMRVEVQHCIYLLVFEQCSTVEIAKLLGIDRATLSEQLRKAGIPDLRKLTKKTRLKQSLDC